ncbi:Serine/threonine-protein phosphatase 7 long form like [Apostasia shenzhenica]|uniref:Serine/threonine-protein phosphatase 7 long form like n=1 Tax=Apostasia shenzhenica TaxID=1088818 RepID=A0A2I0A5Z7_9ASPA|nr:Serine/threonine-protein phosphatase 7 long form like [Apostasia shenzhenica]
MLREWPMTCPIFIDAFNIAGVGNIRYLDYIILDHRLLAALVRRLSLETNTFHLPVGEMIVTLQDIAVILGIRIDGNPLISHVHVAERYK